MALRVNTNTVALNAQRILDSHQNNLARVFEHLSSGLRINRAADDTAGLAISEKLRSQIRGLNQAIANAQDDINLIQTAEGALNEAQNILHRMRELAIQAANDTLVNSDRKKIQEEFNQLKLELHEIATRTQFNGRNLLDGSISSSRIDINPSLQIKQNIRVGDNMVTIPNIRDFITGSSLFTSVGINVATVDVAYQFKIVAYKDPLSSDTDPITTTAIEVHSSLEGFLRSVIVGTPTTLISLTVGGVEVGYVSVDFFNMISLCDIGKTALVQVIGKYNAISLDKSLVFHVGPNEGQILRLGLDDMTPKALRLETLTLVGTFEEDTTLNKMLADEKNRLLAQNAIGVIDNALEKISSLRSRLGAVQNRLESKIKNLSITSENTSITESQIRDIDVAKETAALTRAQILVQAGTAILAQANANPQSALQLLK